MLTHQPPLYLCIFFPTWSADLARVQLKNLGKLQKEDLGRSVILIQQSATQTTVRRCCTQAQQAGVREGMSLALAQALSANAIVAQFDHARDVAALKAFGQWALSITPTVALEQESLSIPPLHEGSRHWLHNGLILDLTGTQRIYKDLLSLALSIKKKLSLVGISSRMGIAPTVGAAWGLSRCGKKEIMLCDNLASEEIHQAPISALRISERSLTLLRELGIRTVNELVALPRKKLLSRFGKEFLHRIDTYFGVSAEPLRPNPAQQTPCATKNFELPLRREESIAKITGNLLEKVLLLLNAQQQKAATFRLHFTIVKTDRSRVCITKELSLSLASENKTHLSTLLSPCIESIANSLQRQSAVDSGFTSITVEALEREQIRQQQNDFFVIQKSEADKSAYAECIDIFIARLGRERITKMEILESFIPEKSFAFTPISRLKEAQKSTAVQTILPERPPYILAEPEPISAVSLLPDRPPSAITWNGEQYRIVHGIGPERIADEWWQRELYLATSQARASLSKHSTSHHSHLFESAWERDYFKVQDQIGRWLWVYRTLQKGSFAWFVHGLWV